MPPCALPDPSPPGFTSPWFIELRLRNLTVSSYPNCTQTRRDLINGLVSEVSTLLSLPSDRVFVRGLRGEGAARSVMRTVRA